MLLETLSMEHHMQKRQAGSSHHQVWGNLAISDQSGWGLACCIAGQAPLLDLHVQACLPRNGVPQDLPPKDQSMWDFSQSRVAAPGIHRLTPLTACQDARCSNHQADKQFALGCNQLRTMRYVRAHLQSWMHLTTWTHGIRPADEGGDMGATGDGGGGLGIMII